MRHPIMIAALTLTLAACTQASVPPAGTLAYGLNASGQLVTFGLDNAGSSATTRSVTGLGSDTLADLDFNPANGALYAFATSGNVYTVDPATGAATLNTTPLSTVAPRVTDFNPAANRVRVIGASASNARLTVDPGPSTSPKGTVTTDGTLAYAATDTNAGKTPNVLGAAYTNSALNGGTLPASTLLYSVDATTNTLDLHSTAPGTAAGNFNTLGTVGALGVTLGSSVGFDIVTRGGMNTAYLVNGSTLYTVNLMTGAATQIATLSTPLKALAVTLSAQ
ncbi:DUF4394 domain-containing protein [Deinococcus aquiradiocola]|uniref:DUF4394 domain-containing protein n=1 Tax=Deinococcus aquiradiocola TaxID=393059 RepID=A0A917PHP1_9DEIO|nr:DUF4394 domain-containing protein [Deinococcus aquiradiocola]GGJ79324.1 hypothetical protein GCM10008939_23940 [Deinococcus aquiradiocola]